MVFAKKQARFQDINEIKEDFYFASIRQTCGIFSKNKRQTLQESHHPIRYSIISVFSCFDCYWFLSGLSLMDVDSLFVLFPFRNKNCVPNTDAQLDFSKNASKDQNCSFVKRKPYSRYMPCIA